uniref:Uncharacterized protein n=1 Tax=Triticum urartu TaxID=4572 RepID=A0A8R7PQ76_TRIUA
MNNWRLVGHAGLERFKTITSSYYLLPGSAWNHYHAVISYYDYFCCLLKIWWACFPCGLLVLPSVRVKDLLATEIFTCLQNDETICHGEEIYCPCSHERAAHTAAK